MVRKTTSEYIRQLEELYPGKYEVLSEYKTNADKIHIRYKKCGHEKWITAFGLLQRGSDCQICKTADTFFKYANERYKDKYEFYGKYVDNDTPIKVKCKKCGCEFDKIPHIISNKKVFECPLCGNCPSLFPYINDMWCTNPDIAKMLVNPEDGHKYKAGSNAKVWFKCPDCGSKIFTSISNVVYNGKPVCRYCSDNISYPEKFMSNILKQLSIDFISQFSPEWAKPYFYDFMFKKDNIKYIVEMDGGMGHGSKKCLKWNNPEYTKKIDLLKDSRATENGFKIIRINCDYNGLNNRFNLIRKNILSSYLSKILDFSIVDFNKCNTNSLVSSISEIAKIWNDGIIGIENIKNKMTMPKSNDTIKLYLQKACEIGLIKESYESVKQKNHELIIKDVRRKRKDIHIVKCIQTGEVFCGYTDANQKYNARLSSYFSSKKYNRKTYKFGGYLEDGTKLDWVIIDEESARTDSFILL